MLKRRYPGVSPFTSEQKKVFFGRDDDIKKLQKLISLRNQILLYSKSGIGKTSLLNAGVLPIFENKFTIIKIRFFAYNSEKSESPLKKTLNSIKSKTNLSETSNILDEISKKTNYKETLWYYFKQLQLTAKKEQKYILAFDQFEELFSYPKEQINEFKNQLYELLKIDIPDNIIQFTANLDNKDIDLLYENIKIKTIFAIRSDRLSLLNELTDKLPDIQETFYELKSLDNEQAKQAIINPAKDKNNFETPIFEYETQTLKKIVTALSNNGKSQIETTQLQIVCQYIENKVIYKTQGNQSNDKITITNKELPNFKDLFYTYYKDVISALEINKQKKVSLFIENELVKDNQRITVDSIICEKEIGLDTLKHLENLRLIRRIDISNNRYSYEISHDTIVQPIFENKQRRIKKEKKEKEKAKVLLEEKKRNQEFKNELIKKFSKNKRLINLQLYLLGFGIMFIVFIFFIESKTMQQLLLLFVFFAFSGLVTLSLIVNIKTNNFVKKLINKDLITTSYFKNKKDEKK